MSRKTKIWLITATFLVLAGVIFFGGAMAVSGWDFTKLSTSKYETSTHNIADSYKNIEINTNTADITIMPSDSADTSVVCYEEENLKHTVAVEDDTLSISLTDTRKWYQYIGINFGTPKITVYLSTEEYEALTIKSSTGDVSIADGAFGNIKATTSTGKVTLNKVDADSLEISVSTGKVTLSEVICDGDITLKVSTGKADFCDVSCKNLTSSGSTGDMLLKNVIAAEKFSITRSTGDISLDGCDASELLMQTDTGNVKGTLLTSKIFAAKSDTGKIDVPKSTIGGLCEITTDTGNIILSVAE